MKINIAIFPALLLTVMSAQAGTEIEGIGGTGQRPGEDGFGGTGKSEDSQRPEFLQRPETLELPVLERPHRPETLRPEIIRPDTGEISDDASEPPAGDLRR